MGTLHDEEVEEVSCVDASCEAYDEEVRGDDGTRSEEDRTDDTEVDTFHMGCRQGDRTYAYTLDCHRVRQPWVHSGRSGIELGSD